VSAGAAPKGVVPVDAHEYCRFINFRFAKGHDTTMTEQRSPRRGRIGSLLVAMAVALLAAMTSPGTAHAAAGADEFARQTQAAGLTEGQAAELQARVNWYLKKMGGTQVAANEIVLDGDARVTVALPGESRARSLGGDVVALTGFGCPYYYFCAYKANYGAGDRITAYYCNKLVGMPWSTTGSFENNQTLGTLARLENLNYGVVTYSYAYEKRYAYNWSPVYFIDPCQS
jgi:hypothetical protein